jgi:hypothetical protein
MTKHSENTEPSNSTKPVLANRLSFYVQPFHISKYGNQIYDGRNRFVAQFEPTYNEQRNYTDEFLELRQKTLFSLNALGLEPIKGIDLSIGKTDETLILNNGKEFITIRGWGNLTGIGGYNFDAEKASKIQDDFRDWIIYKLSTQTTS